MVGFKHLWSNRTNHAVAQCSSRHSLLQQLAVRCPSSQCAVLSLQASLPNFRGWLLRYGGCERLCHRIRFEGNNVVILYPAKLLMVNTSLCWS